MVNDGECNAYLSGAYAKTVWDRDRWEMRKEMVADSWHRKSENGQKRIIAMLLMHAGDVKK